MLTQAASWEQMCYSCGYRGANQGVCSDTGPDFSSWACKGVQKSPNFWARQVLRGESKGTRWIAAGPGEGRSYYGVTGKFGLGIRNEAGQRLTEFCQENALVIANTLFQQHKRRLYTCTSSDGQISQGSPNKKLNNDYIDSFFSVSLASSSIHMWLTEENTRVWPKS